MNRKNAEKCMIPAMSVSANSTKRVVWKGVGMAIGFQLSAVGQKLKADSRQLIADSPTNSVAHIRQERHKPRPLDGSRHCMLTGRVAAGLTTADDPAVPVRELRQ
jgi:hypothetical protein